MSEENNYNNEQTPEETEVPEIPENENDIAGDSGSDIYVYDAEDDEPVPDRDLYSDYTGERISVPAFGKSEDIAKPEQSRQTVENSPEPTVTAEPKPETKSARHSERPTPAYKSESEPTYYDKSDDDTEEPELSASQPIKVNRINTINIVISMITLCIVAAGVFTGFTHFKRLEQDLGDIENRISGLEKGSGSGMNEEAVDAISIIGEEEREEASVPMTDNIDIDRGKVLIYDSYVGYGWVPVLAGVRQNTYKSTDFTVDDRFRMTYKPNDEESSYFGIDVSSHQGDIDWDAVRSDGVEFAILRIGLRGYGEEGNIKLDEKFYENYEKAHKAGIDVGIYFYSQAISTDEAEEEAKFVLEKLDGRKLEYPIVFDWEPATVLDPNDVPRTEDVMPGTLTLSAISFCETIRDAGYDSMIYLGKKLAYLKYDLRQLGDYPVWLALYSTDMTYIYDFDIWQYGAGEVDGIEGDVDFNVAIIR